MFMRFVQVTIDTDRLLEFVRVYEEAIIPALEKTEGCLYAALVQNVNRQEEGISITLWDSEASAGRYEKSGAYHDLVMKSQPYFSNSSEWQVHLSKDLQLEYGPVRSAPVVKRYNNSSEIDATGFMKGSVPSLYLRMVSMKVQPSKLEECRSIYNNEIVPVLRSVPGCRHCFLTESLRDPSEVMSVTIWESLKHAQEYESEGKFRTLLEKLKHTLSGLYQWKVGFEEGSSEGTATATGQSAAGKAVTSDDLSVNAYNVVVGKAFR